MSESRIAFQRNESSLEKVNKLELSLPVTLARRSNMNLVASLWVEMTAFKHKNKDAKCEILFAVGDRKRYDVLTDVFEANPDLIPFGCTMRLEYLDDDQQCAGQTPDYSGRGILAYTEYKDKEPGAREFNPDTFWMTGNLGSVECDYDEADETIEQYLPTFKNRVNEWIAIMFFGTTEGLSIGELVPSKCQVFIDNINKDSSAFDKAVSQLYQVAHEKYRVLEDSITNPNAIAIVETMRLKMVMDSSVTKDEKLDAIKYYLDKCDESWGSFLGRLAITVVCAAVGAVFGAFSCSALGPLGIVGGAVAGMTAGSFVADRICKASFFAHQVCVDKVAAAALQQVAPDEESEVTGELHALALATTQR